ncbi:uncharacterized protein LOC143150110 [Ptiloglossa arizonensis]|uniref:uncharacterized protein LOC143150110 n=1 Tax=Ptiloglossa arizonensis TaxID=3350558 RepID=UPI003FA0DB5D
MSFHEFNPVTSRLKESTRPQPLYPVSPRPLKNIENPVMFYDSIKTKPVKTMLNRQAEYSTLSPRMATLYKKFQRDLTIPSYLLAGTRDVIIIRSLWVGTMASFAYSMCKLYEISKT